MKKFLILLSFLISSYFGFSQNGGLVNENSVIRIDYVGYNSQTGNFQFAIVNKQNCQVNAQYFILHTNQLVEIVIPANGTYILFVPGIPSEDEHVKARATSFCVNSIPDSGWVENDNQVGTVLPIKFKSFQGKRLDSKTIEITFEVEEDSDLSHYIIKVSPDGVNFKNVMLLFPDKIIGHKKYVAKIKL